MANTELVTAVQEGVRLTVVLLANGGFQSIHRLQLATTGSSFGNELRHRRLGASAPDGELVDVDYAANARSLGCAAFAAADVEGVRAALASAREEPRPSVIVCDVEPLRGLPDAGAFWDIGVPHASADARVRRLADEHRERARGQRRHV